MPNYYGADGKAYPDFASAQATFTGLAPQNSAVGYQNKTREDIAGYAGIALSLVDALVGLPGMNQQRELESQRLAVLSQQQQLAAGASSSQPVATVAAEPNTPWLLIGGVAGGAVVLSVLVWKVLD